MSLLANLVLFGNQQSTTMQFCHSPKEKQSSLNFQTINSHRQSLVESDRPRPVSKSLAKMSLFASNQKIDPKERIIHRLVYKLEMKCRKHFYNFFVKLEHFKKKPVKPVINKLDLLLPQFCQRMGQICVLLYSKYFERSHKKEAFESILKLAKITTFSKKIQQAVNKKKSAEYFHKLTSYSKFIEKNQIRHEILASSIKNIVHSFYRTSKMQLLELGFREISKNFRISTQNCKKSPNNGYGVQKNKECVEDSKKSSTQKLALKISSKTINLSQKIIISKAHSTNPEKFVQKSIQAQFSNQTPNSLRKRCQIDFLHSHEVSDIYDSNTLFLEAALNSCIPRDKILKEKHSNSYVKEKQASKDQGSSQTSLSFYFPLNQQEKLILSKKVNSFGSSAVSFKNSLIFGRQNLKEDSASSSSKEILEKFMFKSNQKAYQTQNVQKELFQEHNHFKSSLKLRINNQVSQKNNSTSKLSRPQSFKIDPYAKSLTPLHSSRLLQTQNIKMTISSRKNIGQITRNSLKDEPRFQKFLKITKKM